MTITPTEYASKAAEFAEYIDPNYPRWALLEELGELCGVFAKAGRVGQLPNRQRIEEEVGDIMWVLSVGFMKCPVEYWTGVGEFNHIPKPAFWFVEACLQEAEHKCWVDLWFYLAHVIEPYTTLHACALTNLAKLEQRRAAGTISLMDRACKPIEK